MDACEKVRSFAGHIPVTADSSFFASWVGYMSRQIWVMIVMELAKDSSLWATDEGGKDTANAIAEMAARLLRSQH